MVLFGDAQATIKTNTTFNVNSSYRTAVLIEVAVLIEEMWYVIYILYCITIEIRTYPYPYRTFNLIMSRMLENSNRNYLFG